MFFGGPWVAGFSDDFGERFQPALAGYEDAARWRCPARRPGRDCCQHLCPGQPVGGMCPDQAPEPGPTCGGPEPPDAGVPVDAAPVDAATVDAATGDAAVDAAPRDATPTDATPTDATPVDASAPDAAAADARPRRDARFATDATPASGSTDDGGCRQAPGPWAPGLLVALLAAARLRKKRQNPANFA
ncbi:MAG: hypothetical protein R3F60_10210 [bacterium]